MLRLSPLPVIALLPLLGITSPAHAQRALTLADALRCALGSDEIIGTAEQDLEGARAEVMDQASSLMPTLEMSGARGKGADESFFLWAQGETTEIDYTFWRAETLFSAPLLAAADIGDLVSARQELRAAEYGLDATRQVVLFDVVRAYYEALSAHSAVDVTQASAAASRALEQAAEQRLATGTETEIEVQRARGRRIAAEGEVHQASFDAHEADLELAHLAHLPLEPFDLALPDTPDLPSESSEQRVDLALGGRPDLLAFHWTSEAARSAVHAQALELVPTLGVRWSTGYGLYAPETARNTPHEWALMLRVDWELPGLIEPAADVAAARAAQQRAELALKRARRDTELVVARAEIALEAAGVAVDVAQERDGVAQANLDAGMRLYREGLGTGLEVSTLNAERDEAAAELLRAVLDRDLARVDLLEAVGADPLAVYAGR